MSGSSTVPTFDTPSYVDPPPKLREKNAEPVCFSGPPDILKNYSRLDSALDAEDCGASDQLIRGCDSVALRAELSAGASRAQSLEVQVTAAMPNNKTLFLREPFEVDS